MIDNERSKRFPFIERSWWPLIPLGAIQHQEQTETLSNRTLSFLQFIIFKVFFKKMCWESCCLYSITWRCGWEKEVHISTFQVNQRRTYINSVKTWLSMVRGRLCGRNSMNRAMERAGGETLWWPYPILSDSWHLKCFSTTLFQFVIHQSARYLSNGVFLNVIWTQHVVFFTLTVVFIILCFVFCNCYLREVMASQATGAVGLEVIYLLFFLYIPYFDFCISFNFF